MWQVVGQEKLVSLLDYSVRTNSIAHAYLLVGQRHVGKGTLATNLAQALNCEGSEPPCGQCRSCQRILEGKHADVTLIRLDSRTEIGIDDIRELQRLANLPPYEGKYKIFIINDAEYLSTEAANSLLKILEEPPPKVVWLLLAAEEERLLPTVVSRCQRLELKPVPSQQIYEVLVNSHKVDADKAKLLTRLCRGRLGWAVSALTDDAILEQRTRRIDRIASLLDANLEQRFAYAQELANQFSENRKAGMEIMEVWFDWWRDLMLMKSGCPDAITNVDYVAILEKQVQKLSVSQIKKFLSDLCLLREVVSRNVNPRLAWEWLVLNLPRMQAVEHSRKLGTKASRNQGL